MKKLTTEKFTEKAEGVHGGFYSYDKVEYVGANDKVEIICPDHGSFFMTPSNHVNNSQGCRKCRDKKNGNKKRKNNAKFLKDLTKKRGSENYSLDDLNFKTRKDKITATCKKHGLFATTPRNMLRSRFFGCQKCRNESFRTPNDVFLNKANNVHNNEYLYEQYRTSHTPIRAFCEKHGEFEIKPYIHLNGNQPCPKCYGFKSKQEREIASFLEEINVKYEPNFRKLKTITEIDLYCPEYKLGIEFNGLFWHSEDKKDKFHLKNKLENCQKKGIRLIHIFEDEWEEKKDCCKDLLKSFFNKRKKVIFARKCSIREVDSETSSSFLEKNHLQGKVNSKLKLGLFYKEELVSLMTFGRKRACLGGAHSDGHWELYRFATKNGIQVTGGGLKLLTFFEKTQKPIELISYCDKRWFNGRFYIQAGFDLKKETEPNYFYTRGNKRLNRFKFRKDALVKDGAEESKTEKQIMEERGYFRIYDCGTLKFTKTYI